MRTMNCQEFLSLKFGDKLKPSQYGIENGLSPDDEGVFISGSKDSSHIMKIYLKSDEKEHYYSTDHWRPKNKIIIRVDYV